MMEIEEKKIDDACNRIMDCINLMSLHEGFKDQQVLSLLKIREIARGVVDGHHKKVSDSHVVEVLRSSIYNMVTASKAIVEKISIMSCEGLEDHWVQSLRRIEELATGMDDQQEVRDISNVRFTESITNGEVEPSDTELLGFEGLMGMVTQTNSEELPGVLAMLTDEEGFVNGEMKNQIVWEPSFQSPSQHSIMWPPDGNVTPSWIKHMTSIFEHSSLCNPPSDFHKNVMSVASVEKLIDAASSILNQEPNCVKINSLGEDYEVVVVGDIHGQFHNLLHLWNCAGCPSENKSFVFNGNYINKGGWGLEVLLVLLAWKVLMPCRIFLLRGNHESKFCTQHYGFMSEVQNKFGEEGDAVYEKFLKCFKDLPLASIISGCVYTTHGGLFRTTHADSLQSSEGNEVGSVESLSIGSLKELARVDRHYDAPDESAPKDALNVILTDVLWSDPATSNGLEENKTQGVGLHWGPDCTEDFLEKHKLKSIIRSHEGPDARVGWKGEANMRNGHNKDHAVKSGNLYTLFSAPDYPQFQDDGKGFKNLGAYAILKSPNFDPHFNSFEAAERPKVKPYGFISTKCMTSQNAMSIVDTVSPAQQSCAGGMTSDVSFQEVMPVGNPPESHISNYDHLLKLIAENQEREKKLMGQIEVLKSTVKDGNNGKRDQDLIEQIIAIERTLDANAFGNAIEGINSWVAPSPHLSSTFEHGGESQLPAKKRLRAGEDEIMKLL